jgi:hypothetical protein
MVKRLGPMAKKVLAKVKRKATRKASKTPVERLAEPAAPTPPPEPEPPPAAALSAAEAATQMGRPSTYDPKYTAMVEELCARGATDQELAEFFEVSQRTINRWKVLHDDFARAVLRGKDVADDRMERSLYHMGMGGEYEKQVPIKLKDIDYDDDGKKVSERERVEIVTIKEFLPPQAAPAIFWLKNRRPKEWRDVFKHEHGRANEFDGMTTEQLKEQILKESRVILEADPNFRQEVQILLPAPPKKARAK